MKLGKWITNNTDNPFYVRKLVEIKKEVKKATALACGLGQFNFYINGKRVDDHVLDPAWTNYKKLVEYVAFDVTTLLQEGTNVVGAEVGNGWFIKKDEYYTFKLPTFMPPNPNPYTPFSKVLIFNLLVEIEYTDGEKEVLISDESFKVKKHPVVMSNVFGSEIVKGELAIKNWSVISLDDSNWENAILVTEEDKPKGELVEQRQNPIKVIKTYRGEYIHEVNNRKIYDFKQNMSGLLEFKVIGKKGDVIKFYPAEKLGEDLDVDQMAKNWVMIDSCVEYIIGEDDVEEYFEMVFTYFAGRFVAVEVSNKNIKLIELNAKAISSAHVKSGNFECDDIRFNQIYDLVEKAVEANMLSVHTDCPTIERFAWQEPNHLMASSIMYMKDVKTLWEKFLRDIRVDQHKEGDYFFDREGNKLYMNEGLVPSQAPCYIANVLPVPGLGSFYDIIPWGSTIILGTYWHYIFYGDKKVIEDNYAAGLAYLKHLKTEVTEDGFINHGLGDWGNPKQMLDRENIETVFLYADVTTLSKFAEIMNDLETKKELDDLASKIKNNYNEKLLVRHSTKGYYYYKVWNDEESRVTQASQALPLYWGLVPKEHEEDVMKAFKESLEDNGSFIAGEISLPYIIQMASQVGLNDLICDFILKPEHPSYYAFVLDGETTLGEYWESNPRSHCHDMMGHIIEWYYNSIAGIKPVKEGFKEVVIKPFMPKSMNEFSCEFNSVNGLIKVNLIREDRRFVLNISIPEGMEYSVNTSNLKGECEVIVD